MGLIRRAVLILAVLAIVSPTAWLAVSRVDAYADCADIGFRDEFDPTVFNWRDGECRGIHSSFWVVMTRDPLPKVLANTFPVFHAHRRILVDVGVPWAYEFAENIPPLTIERAEWGSADPDATYTGTFWVTWDSAERWLSWSESREAQPIHARVRVRCERRSPSGRLYPSWREHLMRFDPGMQDAQDLDFTPPEPFGAKTVHVYRAQDDDGVAVFEEPGCCR